MEPPSVNNQVSEAEIIEAIRLLKYRKRRQEAEQKLRRMGVQAVAPLLAAFREEEARRLQRRRFGFLALPAYAALAAGIYLIGRNFPEDARGLLICPGYIFGYGLCSTFFQSLSWPTGRQRRITQLLATSEDLSVVGALVEGLGHSPYNGSVVNEALIHLLPRLQATDAALLNFHQRAYLYRALKQVTRRITYYDEAVILAILRALEQIGDAEALPYVEPLTHFRKSEAIAQAAQACLPYLQQKQQQQQYSQTLLRSSVAFSQAPETLLRPAQRLTETQPQELLRAAEQEKPGFPT
jgi:hypothetical protein